MKDRGKDRHTDRDHRRSYMRGYHRQYSLRKQYDLSLEQFINILVEQKNACLICERVFTHHNDTGKKGLSPHVDHCHETGMVRGLLCDRCNRGLGHFLDDSTLMLKAASYLVRNKGTQPGEKK